MMAPAVSASWASTFLGEKQVSDPSLGMRDPCPAVSSTGSWEEGAGRRPQRSQKLCFSAAEEQQEQIHLGSKSLPPHYRLIKKEKMHQAGCPEAPGTMGHPSLTPAPMHCCPPG